MATPVVVTTSLPQSSSGPSAGIYPLYDFFNYQAPQGCFGIGAVRYIHDIQGGCVKRDSQSPETHAGALDPRTRTPLACGKLVTGGQSDTFGFPTNKPTMLLWNMGSKNPGFRLVSLVQVNKNGPDIVVLRVGAYKYSMLEIIPIVGAFYYVLKSRIIGALTLSYGEDVYNITPPALPA